QRGPPSLPQLRPRILGLLPVRIVKSYFETDSTFLTTTPAPVFHRFLMKAENDTYPLCFDVIGAVILKLLHHPSTG
ncbi:hypothetical protein GOODEAATRI_030463, partial [Goodea atripinnis]